MNSLRSQVSMDGRGPPSNERTSFRGEHTLRMDPRCKRIVDVGIDVGMMEDTVVCTQSILVV